MPRSYQSFRALTGAANFAVRQAPQPVQDAVPEYLAAVERVAPALRDAEAAQKRYDEALRGKGKVKPSKLADALFDARKKHHEAIAEAERQEKNLVAVVRDHREAWRDTADQEMERTWTVAQQAARAAQDAAEAAYKAASVREPTKPSTPSPMRR